MGGHKQFLGEGGGSRKGKEKVRKGKEKERKGEKGKGERKEKKKGEKRKGKEGEGGKKEERTNRFSSDRRRFNGRNSLDRSSKR